MNSPMKPLDARPVRPSWGRALLGAVRPHSLWRTIPAATIVGTTLFWVNLYANVRDDPFTWLLAMQIALTYLVPWMNATMGIAIGLRHAGSSAAHSGGGPPNPHGC